MPRKIIITGRRSDVHAAFTDAPGKWGCGESKDEAIGSLVRSWPEDFGVEIVDETRPEPAPRTTEVKPDSE